MKNHVRVNGQLRQTNKPFSQLKQTQKEWITQTFVTLYHAKMTERNTTDKLPSKARDEVILNVYAKMEDRGMWLPFHELEMYCFNKIHRTVTRYRSPNFDNTLS